MKRTVFSDAEVADLIEKNYVPVAVDDIRDESQERSPAVTEDGVPVLLKMVLFLSTARERLDALEKNYRKAPKPHS